jgi:hypothetical protein
MSREEGTGLRFDGYPNDIEQFNWILAKEGCHPKAAKRILDRIDINGYDLLTVMNRLNFDYIFDELGKIGVQVSFIEPLKGWVGYKFDDGGWPEELMKKIFKR